MPQTPRIVLETSTMLVIASHLLLDAPKKSSLTHLTRGSETTFTLSVSQPDFESFKTTRKATKQVLQTLLREVANNYGKVFTLKIVASTLDKGREM